MYCIVYSVYTLSYNICVLVVNICAKLVRVDLLCCCCRRRCCKCTCAFYTCWYFTKHSDGWRTEMCVCLVCVHLCVFFCSFLFFAVALRLPSTRNNRKLSDFVLAHNHVVYCYCMYFILYTWVNSMRVARAYTISRVCVNLIYGDEQYQQQMNAEIRWDGRAKGWERVEQAEQERERVGESEKDWEKKLIKASQKE